MRSLEAEEIHVWPVRLAAPDSSVKEFGRLLTVDERERAARFRTEELRRRFTLARGMLRLLLSHYTGVPAAQVRLTYGQRGKPALASGEALQFNVSHTGNLAMYAFALHCEIGIDVEQVRPMDDLLGIAENYFCPEEAAELRSITAGRDSAFFRCWTRKEAYLKAIGDGLQTPLDTFRVSVLPDDPVRLIHEAKHCTRTNEWQIYDLAVEPEYAAALAYRGRTRTIVAFPETEEGGSELDLPGGLTASHNCGNGQAGTD